MNGLTLVRRHGFVNQLTATKINKKQIPLNMSVQLSIFLKSQGNGKLAT